MAFGPILLALVTASAAAAADDVFREPLEVHPVLIELPAADYEAMRPREGKFTWFGFVPDRREQANAAAGLEAHRNNFGVDLPWEKGAVTLAGQRFEPVGLRYKGNGTIGDSRHTAKKSIKVDLDRHDATARFQGSPTINLHAGAADPTKCRETLGYSIYRAAGVPAPRTALAEVRLSVPGKFDQELLGVYTVVEAVDKAFLQDRFGNGEGLLFKPERVRDLEDLGDSWTAYEQAYDPARKAKPEEAERLMAFARLVAKADDQAFAEQIESFLDVEAYLRFLAATALVANIDSFFVLGHNYYLYLHPTSGRFHFIPWDVDRALGNFPGVLGSNAEQMDLRLTHPYAGTHRLTERLLAIPRVGERYQALLRELAATCFEKARLLTELAAIEAAVSDLRTREQQASAARQEGKGHVFGAGNEARLDTFLAGRADSVAAQVAGASKGFRPTRGFPFQLLPPPPERK
jgi:spore coat protein CotH